MTLSNGYVIMKERYERMVQEAESQYLISGLKRDRERLDYLRGRLKRFTI